MRRFRRQAAAGGLTAYLESIGGVPPLSAAQELSLATRVAGGDEAARDHMVRANLALVVHIAARYLRRGRPMEDMVAEGNLGLVRAVEGFDPACGVRFGTYAGYWIKQSIRRAAMNQEDLVRLPAHMHTLLSKWRRAARILVDRLGREPAPEEVARRLGLTPRRLRMALAALAVDAAIGARGDAEEEDDPTLSLADVRSDSAEERASAAEQCERLAERMGRLDERESTILRMRFGLGGGPTATLQAIGDRLGVTREWACRLEKRALARLA